MRVTRIPAKLQRVPYKDDGGASLRAFAKAVTDQAYAAPARFHFGRYKVFLAAVPGAFDSPRMRERLWRAHQAGYLHLARADLTPAMERPLIDASEIRVGHATFHFVVLPDNRPWTGPERDPRRRAHLTKRQRAAQPKRRRPSRDPGLDKKALWKDIERQHAHERRATIARLRSGVQDARTQDRARCAAAKTKRAAAIAKLRAKVARLVHAVRWQVAQEKLLAQRACKGQRTAPAARQALAAERAHHASLRRSARGARAKERPSIAKVRASESDDEVRANLPPELVPLFNRVRRGIRATPRISRTEAFLQYVDEHPHEAFAGLEDATDALIADLERQQRAGRR